MACPVCSDARANVSDYYDEDFRRTVSCPTCGAFLIDHSVEKHILEGKAPPQQLADLCVILRHSQPVVVTVTWDNWDALLAQFPEFSLRTKLQRLLAGIGRRFRDVGAVWVLKGEPLRELRAEIAARSVVELHFLLGKLIELEWIEPVTPSEGSASFHGRVSFEGWLQLDPIGGGTKGRCFVAMSFASDLDEPYNSGLRQGIINAGLDPRRMKEIATTDKICDRLLAEIRAAECIVADLTNFSPNVLFEAGYALALGKPVIYTCQKDAATPAVEHFDTRQYPHLSWTNPADWRNVASERLRALGLATKHE
jgi:hypothetical protein